MSKLKAKPTDQVQLRFVLGCGGTGGHIIPGIALAQELSRLGHQVLFIGNHKGLEETIVKAAGFDFQGINVQKLYRKISLSNLLFPFKLISSTCKTWRILHGNKPDGVICTGGFVSGPVALAALVSKVPLYFHESNSFPGLTTRLLARYTRLTFVSFAGAVKRLKQFRTLQLGIPIPPTDATATEFQLAEIGLDASKPVILVTGGSQGSLAINNAVDASLQAILDLGLQLIWQTGRKSFDQYSARHAAKKGLYIFDFSSQLSSFYRVAQLAITRAGAMTVAELEANKLPAIMIPLPTAADNHQHFNALEQQKRGLAQILPQKELDSASLLAAIQTMLQNLASYQAKLRELPPNTASHDIIQAILANLKQE